MQKAVAAVAAGMLAGPEGPSPADATDDEVAAHGAGEAGAVLTAPVAGAGVDTEPRQAVGMPEVGG